MCTVDYATNVCSPQRSAYAQLSPVYLLSTPYVTHVIIYFRPSTTFHYCKRWKAGRGQEMTQVNKHICLSAPRALTHEDPDPLICLAQR